jgi:hypothetical protein
MANLFSSTNDPLFFIHHGGIDHFWYQWQERNKTRFNDVRRSVIDFHRLNEPVPSDRIEGITTLDTPVFQTGEFAPLIHVSQVMDTINQDGNGFLCYVYDSEYVDFRGTPVANAMPNGGKPNLSAYPSVPVQKLQPWTGLEEGEDAGWSTSSSPGDSGHRHHGPDLNMTKIPEINHTAMPQAADTATPSVVFPAEKAAETEKPKTSMAQGKSFLGLGVQPGSGSQHGSSSSLYDPTPVPERPSRGPAKSQKQVSRQAQQDQPSWSYNEQEMFESEDQVQGDQVQEIQQQFSWPLWENQPLAPPGGYAPPRLVDSGLLPLKPLPSRLSETPQHLQGQV